MIVIIGLGNPGKEYQYHRHNIGHMVIDRLAGKLNTALNTSKFDINHSKSGSVIIGKTNVYMNLSGIPIRQLLNFYKISPQQLYIVHDDLDLAVGEYRQQFDRGPAGHNGIKSIIEQLGTQQFNRIRIGIDHPQQIPVEDYVLQPFTPSELPIINKVIEESLEALVAVINQN